MRCGTGLSIILLAGGWLMGWLRNWLTRLKKKVRLSEKRWNGKDCCVCTSTESLRIFLWHSWGGEDNYWMSKARCNLTRIFYAFRWRHCATSLGFRNGTVVQMSNNGTRAETLTRCRKHDAIWREFYMLYDDFAQHHWNDERCSVQIVE